MIINVSISIQSILTTALAVVGLVAFCLRYRIVRWEIKQKQKRQIARQKKMMSKQQEQIVDGIRRVVGFCDMLNKSMANNKERKQFWLEFATKPEKRQEIFDKLYKQFAPKPKVVAKPKVEVKKPDAKKTK